MTTLSPTSSAKPNSSLSRLEAASPGTGRPSPTDHGPLTPGARIGLCLAGMIFLVLASKMFFDLIQALLRG